MKEEAKLVLPEEDERLHFILTKLTEGVDREELAEELGNKNFKSVDMYMRRRGYRWDARMKNYVPNVEEVAVEIATSKASRVIQLIRDYPEDLPAVCHKLRFQDLKELKEYMTAKGYTWNNKLSNYELFNPVVRQASATSVNSLPEQKQEGGSFVEESSLAPYLTLLKMLKHNEERLTEMLIPFGEGAELPRYAIEGIKKPKTVQLVHTVGNLVTDYAEEKGMHQNEIVQIALIEFFRKYGFEKEVATLLKST